MYQVEQPPGQLPDISALVHCFPRRWKHLSRIYPAATLRECLNHFWGKISFSEFSQKPSVVKELTEILVMTIAGTMWRDRGA
jgi:hypothetical protein